MAWSPRVVPQELIVDEAVELGKEIAETPPISVRLAKEAVTRAFEGRVDDGIDFERKALLSAVRDAGRARGHARVRRQAPAQLRGPLSDA